jgi:hypothetical protein
MRHGIREFRPRAPLGQQLSASVLNQIRKELESLRITRVVNGTFRKLPGGTEIVLSPPRGGGGGGTPATVHPFKVSASANETNVIVTVRPGTINSVLPSNTFTANALTPLTLALDTIGHVVLSATSDGAQITSAVLSVDLAAPDAQTPAPFSVPTSAKWLLGVVYNTSVYQLITDNLDVSGVQQFIADRASPAAPGQLPYEPFYVWG